MEHLELDSIDRANIAKAQAKRAINGIDDVLVYGMLSVDDKIALVMAANILMKLALKVNV